MGKVTSSLVPSPMQPGYEAGATRRVLCTLQLLGLTVIGHWVGQLSRNGLRKCYSHLVEGSFLAGKAA